VETFVFERREQLESKSEQISCIFVFFSRDFLGNQTEQNPNTDLVEAAGVLFHFSIIAVLADL
jgi:hypothetical protein